MSATFPTAQTMDAFDEALSRLPSEPVRMPPMSDALLSSIDDQRVKCPSCTRSHGCLECRVVAEEKAVRRGIEWQIRMGVQ